MDIKKLSSLAVLCAGCVFVGEAVSPSPEQMALAKAARNNLRAKEEAAKEARQLEEQTGSSVNSGIGGKQQRGPGGQQQRGPGGQQQRGPGGQQQRGPGEQQETTDEDAQKQAQQQAQAADFFKTLKMGPDELKRLNDLLANPELRDAVEKLIEDYRTTGKYRQDLVANVIRLVPEQDRASFKHALDIIATEATDPKNARFTVQMILGGVGIVVTLALFAYFGKGQIATWLRGTYNACRGVVASIFHKATQLVAGMRTAAPAAAPAAAPEPPAPAARTGWGWR